MNHTLDFDVFFLIVMITMILLGALAKKFRDKISYPESIAWTVLYFGAILAPSFLLHAETLYEEILKIFLVFCLIVLLLKEEKRSSGSLFEGLFYDDK